MLSLPSFTILEPSLAITINKNSTTLQNTTPSLAAAGKAVTATTEQQIWSVRQSEQLFSKTISIKGMCKYIHNRQKLEKILATTLYQIPFITVLPNSFY